MLCGLKISKKVFIATLLLNVTKFNDANAKSDVEISISSKGNEISFDKTEIKVPFKPKISIVFKNLAVKNSGIQHNIVILLPGKMDELIKELQKFQYDLTKIKSSQLILAFSKILEPETSETITFEPKAAGSYPFLCTMPGHGDMLNMRGTIQVVDSKK